MVPCRRATDHGRPHHRVMVVEDEADLRDMMQMLLNAEGFDADVACDGRDALERLRRDGRRPRVILLDMMMPRMDGWAFRQRQLADPVLAPIPVVIVSAAP